MVTSRKNGNSGYWAYADNFTRNAAGAVASMQLGNGTWEATTFNSRLQPTQIAVGVTQGTTGLLKLDYTYGSTANNGNVLSQTITAPTVGGNTGFVAVQTYTYDSLNRLKDATETLTPSGGSATQTWKQTFTYDRYGNRNFDEANTTTLPRNCGTSPNLTVCTADRKVYNPAITAANNRLSTADGYAFDGAGNTTGDAQGRTFTYDAESKQVEVKNSSNQTVGQYFYDGDGKRVKKYVPGTGETTIFIYDATGKLVAEYSTIVANTNDAQVAYLTNDHLGSPRINTDKNGNVTARHDYHPFGEEVATSQRTVGLGYADDTVKKQFTGYERDKETQLDFAEARMYEYERGRFASPDPSPESTDLRLPQSINRYVYVMNNPFKFVDPTGLIWVQAAGCEGEKCQPRWIPDEDWNEMSDEDRKPYQVIENFTYDSAMGYQVILDKRGPNPDNPLGWSKGGPNSDSNAGVLVGSAIVISQLDSPAPGPADIVALVVLAGAGVAALMQEAAHQLPLDPNLYMAKNDSKANEKRVAAAMAELERLKAELAVAASKPNKTPEDKGLIDKLKKAIKNAIDRMKKSEPHSRTGERH